MCYDHPHGGRKARVYKHTHTHHKNATTNAHLFQTKCFKVKHADGSVVGPSAKLFAGGRPAVHAAPISNIPFNITTITKDGESKGT